MRRLLLTAALAIVMIAPAAAAETDDDGFITLFNGKDLTGWKTESASRWIVEKGTLTLKDRSDGREHNFNYLWVEKPYANFVLDLECKMPERANSGIFLRTSDLKDPVYTGIEVQVCNSYGREQLSKGGTAGAIYDCLAPTKNTVKKPGEWNRFVIVCKDNRILVVLNGQKVIDMDLDRWTEPNKNPDGTKNKFSTAVKDFARKGYIGLQDHGLPIWYRNVKIKSLDRE